MLSIYEELIYEKIITIDIENHYESIIKSYSDMTKSDIYKEYDKLIKETTISPIEELSLLKENKELKDLSNTNYIKSLKIKCLKDKINKLIETKEINKYKNCNLRYYPRIEEYNNYDGFLKELSKKKEFAIHYIPKKIINSCIKDIFTLSPHQLFLKNYMSPSTPYNSILIFHGVGVGKTCSGVSIAENFKDISNKTIILAPEKIQSGWKKNIYDPLKEENQCTQDEYMQAEDKYEKNKEKMAKKRIKEYYDMYGYLSFSNSVKRYLEENTKMIPKKDLISIKHKEIELIKEKYSNRVLIIDEVHKIRSEDSLIKERDTILYIEKVIKYSDNLKLILLTANPMFNQPDEIIWILNMMLLNDKRNIIKDNIKFNENDLLPESYKLIKEYSKGYVSYLRGENPTTFPYRIDISQIKGEETRILKPKSKNIFNSDNLTPDMKFMKLYSSKLMDIQLEKYIQEIKEIEGKDNISDVTYYGKMLQISNCIFPVDSLDIKDCFGTNGLRNCFTIKNKKPIKYTLKKNIKNFLDLDELGKYACKIKTIIEKIIDSEGISFIYSNFLDGGIMPLVLALEQNGFTKYDKEEVLLSSNKRKPISYDGKQLDSDGYRATYSVIAGSSLKLTNNFEKELNILNSYENRDGKLIKVVIGSTVAAEGIDFKNIRNIHLLEPWHNINKLEQVIGRGIRNCSHSMLDDENKNVTIYLHSCDIKNNESIETYMYHNCEDKATQIGQIEKILKEVSIDKYLFRFSNIIKDSDIEEITINPSKKGNNKFTDKPFDKSYSRTCSFLEKCDYIDDKFSIVETIKNGKIQDSTFNIDYSQSIINTYKKYISGFISEFLILNYAEIVDKMNKKIDNLIVDILNHALDQMINTRYNININNTDGYINYIGNYYVFQPIHNKDKYLSSYYRVNSGKRNIFNYNLDTSGFNPLGIPEIQNYDMKDFDGIVSMLKYKNDELHKKLGKDNKDEYKKIFGENIIEQFVIDRCEFIERCKIMYLLIESSGMDKETKEKYKVIDTVNGYFNKLLIYKGKDNKFTLVGDKNQKPFGFFILYYRRMPNGEPKFFRFNYEKEKEKMILESISLCNDLLEDDILSDLYKIKKNKDYIKSESIRLKSEYGYLIYRSGLEEQVKGPYYKIICKYKEDGQEGEGQQLSKIGGWNAYGGPDRLKTIIKNLDKDSSGVDPSEDIIYNIILIELLLRKNKTFFSGDLYWLYRKELKSK